MKTQYVANDGKVFGDKDKCQAHEKTLCREPTPYAKALMIANNDQLVVCARDYAKWLRVKQDYPTTDSGEHKCCDLLEEMALRLT